MPIRFIKAVFVCLACHLLTPFALAQSISENRLVVFSQSHPLMPEGAAQLEMTLFDTGRLHIVRPEYYVNSGEFDLELSEDQISEFITLAIQGRREGTTTIAAAPTNLSSLNERRDVVKISDATISSFEIFLVDPATQQSTDNAPVPARSEVSDRVTIENLSDQAMQDRRVTVQSLAQLEAQFLRLFERIGESR